MILNVSGRTDIPAFYSKWFFNRYKEGYVDVRNPFNQSLISRIFFEDVEAIFFCTKNPLPMLKYVKEIDKPMIFHITITGYNKDIEPNVLDKTKIIEGVKELSKIIGKENIVIRYDPIFLSKKYTLEYHIKAFDKLCSLLKGSVNNYLISFIDDYKNVRRNKNVLKYRNFTDNDYKVIGENFSRIAAQNDTFIHTCFEDRDLTEYGFVKGECLSQEVAYRLTGNPKRKKWKARKGGKCKCVEMADIGVYNTCNHRCRYCYANFDEESIINNMKKHDENSSLLIGHITKNDIIKVRK